MWTTGKARSLFISNNSINKRGEQGLEPYSLSVIGG